MRVFMLALLLAVSCFNFSIEGRVGAIRHGPPLRSGHQNLVRMATSSKRGLSFFGEGDLNLALTPFKSKINWVSDGNDAPPAVLAGGANYIPQL